MSGRDISTNFPRHLLGKSIDYNAIKANAYRDHGIAIIDLADSRIPWQDREIIEGACKRIYGDRKAG